MEGGMEVLGERDIRVLKTVVAQYIITGESVGSRLVAKISGLNLSPASIRTVMLELEAGPSAQGTEVRGAQRRRPHPALVPELDDDPVCLLSVRRSREDRGRPSPQEG